MTWTSPDDIRDRLERSWRRGDLLRPFVGGDSPFPLRVSLKAPSPSERVSRFEAVKAWVTQVASLPSGRVEWKEKRDRVLGLQRLPVAVWIDSLDDALDWIGKRADAQTMAGLVDLTRQRYPAALAWMARHPLRALELAESWTGILDVVSWIEQRPESGLFARQIDIPGIHSKFVEHHLGLVRDVLVSSGSMAEGGLGLARKPVRIRFRVLDANLLVVPGTACPDVTLDAGSFAALSLPVEHVFVTENEVSFLTFPRVPKSIVVFGAGYGWQSLARARWLQDVGLYYWGDIDTHGFAILDRLRFHFPSARSLLMDRETLMAHASVWGEEDHPVTRDLVHLAEAERSVFDGLRRGDFRKDGSPVRLEQEHIGADRLAAALRAEGLTPVTPSW